MSEICRETVDHALIERLATFPRYQQLPPDSLSQLVAAGVVCSVKPGEVVLEEGEPGTSMFIMISGRLKMTRAVSKGRRALLALFGVGDLFGISSFSGRRSDVEITALETSAYLDIPHGQLLATLEANPQLIGEFLPVFTYRVAECNNCALEGVFLRVEPRLARLFLRLSESVGQICANGVFIPVHLSRQDLADMAGTTIETTIRIMSRWGKEDIISTRNDGFLLQDQPALERLCAN